MLNLEEKFMNQKHYRLQIYEIETELLKFKDRI